MLLWNQPCEKIYNVLGWKLTHSWRAIHCFLFFISKKMKIKYWRVINQVNYLLMLHHYYVGKSMRFWWSIVPARKRSCWKVMFLLVFVRSRRGPFDYISHLPGQIPQIISPRAAPPSRTIPLGAIHTTGPYPPRPYPHLPCTVDKRRYASYWNAVLFFFCAS